LDFLIEFNKKKKLMSINKQAEIIPLLARSNETFHHINLKKQLNKRVNVSLSNTSENEEKKKEN